MGEQSAASTYIQELVAFELVFSVARARLARGHMASAAGLNTIKPSKQ